jgi:hypothetical protein
MQDSAPNMRTADVWKKLDRAGRAARLKAALAAYRCPGKGRKCATSFPLVASTVGDMRYVKCRRCGRTGQIIAR